jgi:hypothetical protein
MPFAFGSDKYIIYGLADSSDLLIRYIGQSKRGLSRPKQHFNKNRSDQTHCANWVRKVQQAGGKILIVVLAVSALDKLNEDERWWIKYGKLSGWDLTNHTEGGEATSGYRHRADTKAKLSELTRNRLNTPEGRAAHLAAHRTPEYRELARTLTMAARKRNPGLMISGEGNVAKRPEIRAKIAARKFGIPRPASLKHSLSKAYYERDRTDKELNYYNKLKANAKPCGSAAAYGRATKKRRLGLPNCGPCESCRIAYNEYNRVLYAKRRT